MKHEASAADAGSLPAVRLNGPGDSGVVDEPARKLPGAHSREALEQTLSGIAIIGDFVMITGSFFLSFWIRFYSGWIPLFNGDAQPESVVEYSELILFGVVTVFLGLLAKNVYDPLQLRSPKNTILSIAVVDGACLFVFTGLVIVLRTSPPVSRLFVVCAFCLIFVTTAAWRVFLSRWMLRPALSQRLRRRLLAVGWNNEVSRIRGAIQRDESMYHYVGWICATGTPDSSERIEGPTETAPVELPLGRFQDAHRIIRDQAVDLVVLADHSWSGSDALELAKICELEHVEFKLVPRFFEILISGLRPSEIGGVPVLGVEALPLSKFENRLLKRVIDIVGATIGLMISVPLMAIFGLLVFIESPGAVIFRQIRMGRNGRLFEMLKIRSMRMDAEPDGKPRWAQENDHRRLKVGAFMRRWNIDEVPQFWNVLKGEMSLVGPRPERPELIEEFKYKIPHYQARHTCPPGMTGWAQVNGLRGNTSLHERIRQDIWYVENWNLWLDLKIMVMTFFRFSNAY